MIKKYFFQLTIFSFIILMGCTANEDTPQVAYSPIVATSDATNITINSATVGGFITNMGGQAIINKGHAWHTEPNPTIFNSRTIVDGATLQFTSNLTDLLPETTYYVRAYAINELGTSYGNEITFTTPPTYAIGDIGPGGGFVFEVDEDGAHGKEIAPLSTQFQSQWGCPISSVSGTSAAAGSGQANADLILQFHNSINYYTDPEQCTDIVIATGDVAAKNCDDLEYMGFNDWYMPSIGDLELVYENLISQDLGDIEDTLLSSSTQAPSDIRSSMILQTSTGETWPLDKNDLTKHRAIRNF